MARRNGSWKAAERQHAKYIGGKRNPINGRGDEPDAESGYVAGESKKRNSLPQWLKKAMKQAEAQARGRLAVAILHEKGDNYAHDYVVMRLSTFRRLIHDAGRANDYSSDGDDMGFLGGRDSAEGSRG